MKSPHILRLGNVRKVKHELSSILDATTLEEIEREIERNTITLYRLGKRFYSFAIGQSSQQWRHKVSRLYYAAYSASRALRLYASGDYSSDVKDHQKFGELPAGFPSKDRFANQLRILRADRNTCDYDHTSKASDLILSTSEAAKLVKEFLREVKAFLLKSGLNV